MAVRIEVVDRIAHVTLDRPEAMNALDATMRRAVQAMWTRIGEDDAIDVAIVTGAGRRAFSAGADLKRTPAPHTPFAAEADLPGGSDSLTATLATDKPIICAFNGVAMGGGLEIGLACDIRIASDNARFALSEVRVGTVPGSGGTQRLARLVGAAHAMHLLLTGDTIDAAEALRIGLVSKVITQDALYEEALAIARRIQANAPLAVRAVKRLVREGLAIPLDAALRLERDMWGTLRDTQDRAEGRAAFAEKRAPRYRGA
jgi:E-phenylitaconyl-CoA hydratase